MKNLPLKQIGNEKKALIGCVKNYKMFRLTEMTKDVTEIQKSFLLLFKGINPTSKLLILKTEWKQPVCDKALFIQKYHSRTKFHYSN